MADTETLQQLKEVWGICQAQDEQKSSLIMVSATAKSWCGLAVKVHI